MGNPARASRGVLEYEKLNIISEGSDSDIYLTRSRAGGELFLLKRMHDQDISGRQMLDRRIRFASEMALASSLEHSSIARPVATVSDEGLPGIVYPFRKGQTLSAILAQGSFFSPEDAVRITLPVLDALEYVHNKGFVHCDINPHNIFVDNERHVQILDFGLAVTEEDAARMPEGHMRGTPPYLSPEQTGVTRFKIDRRSDLFCAALVLYRLISGKLPFSDEQDDILSLFDSILKREVEPVRGIPATLNGVILKSLRADPDDRYQTAAGFMHDLSHSLRDQGVHDEPFQVGNRDALLAVNRNRSFVGHEDIVESLVEGLSQAKNRKTQYLAVVSGPSGIGKSEILIELRKRAAGVGVQFRNVKCHRFTPHQPFSVIRDFVLELLNGLVRDPVAAKDLRAHVEKELAADSGVICRSIPEMSDFFETVNQVNEVEVSKERERTEHVLRKMMHVLAGVYPHVLAIDDMQWIDKASFDIIRDLWETDFPCLHLVSYRTDENSQDTFVHGSDLHSYAPDIFIKVGAFTPTDVSAYIRKRFGAVQGLDCLTESLSQRIDGRPLFLDEACRWLVTSKHLYKSGDEWHYTCPEDDDIPAKFDPASIVLLQLEELSEQERRYLTVASLIEGIHTPAMSSSVLDLDEEDARRVADSLEKKGFLRGHLHGGYSFTHDRVQESVSGALGAEERGRLYNTLTATFLELAKSQREYLFNAAQCSLKGTDARTAIDSCRLAAAHASRSIAHETAIHFYNRALLLLQTGSNEYPESHRVITDIQERLGDLLMLCGRNEQALKMFELLLRKHEERQGYSEALTRYKLGVIHHNMGDFNNAIETFGAALTALGVRIPKETVSITLRLVLEIFKGLFVKVFTKLLPRFGVFNKCDEDSLLKVRILNHVSYSLYFHHMYRGFLAHLKALRTAHKLISCGEKSEAYTLHSVPSYQCCLKKRSFHYVRQAIRIAASGKRPDARAFAEFFLGVLHYFSADWDRAVEWLKKSSTTYETIGNKTTQALQREHLWKIHFMRGELTEALREIDGLLDLCRNLNEQHTYISSLAAKYYISILTEGSEDRSLREHIEAELRDNSSFLTLMHAGWPVAQADLLMGRLTPLETRLKHLQNTMSGNAYNSEYETFAHILAAELEVAQIQAQQTPSRVLRRPTDLLRFKLATCTYPAYRGGYARLKAWQYARKNRNRKAEKLFLGSITQHHDMGMRYEEARSYRDYGDFLSQNAQPGKARDQYNRAYVLFRKCGAVLDMDRLRSKASPEFVESEELATRKLEKRSTSRSTAFSMNSEIDRIRLDTLHQLSAMMETVEDTTELLKQIIRAQMQVTGARYGRLLLRGYDDGENRGIAMDYEGRELADTDLPVRTEILETVQNGDLVCKSESEIAGLPEGGNGQRMRSILCVPLTKAGSYLGCVYLANDNMGGLFTEGAQKAAQILAAQAAILLENARLIDKYRGLARNLEETVREQTASLTTKNRQLESYTVKLLESERVKNILTGALVHDIKNAATGIAGTFYMLEKKIPTMDQRLERMVKFSSASCNDIVNFSSNLLDITRMEEGKLAIRHSALDARMLSGLFQRHSDNPIFAEKNISVQYISPDHQFEIPADKYLLDRVFQNLLNNAAKYVPAGGTVTFSVEQNGEEEVLTFFSTGDPIPQEFRDRIFEKYSRVSENGSPYSKGLGLFFCKLVLTAHDGRIWLETGDEGNYFKMSLPHLRTAERTEEERKSEAA